MNPHDQSPLQDSVIQIWSKYDLQNTDIIKDLSSLIHAVLPDLTCYKKQTDIFPDSVSALCPKMRRQPEGPLKVSPSHKDLGGARCHRGHRAKREGPSRIETLRLSKQERGQRSREARIIPIIYNEVSLEF